MLKHLKKQMIYHLLNAIQYLYSIYKLKIKKLKFFFFLDNYLIGKYLFYFTDF